MLCDEHRIADRDRQCEAALGSNGSARRCRAWPERELPYCSHHDPVARELRREEALSARARIKAVEKAVTSAPRLVQARLLALLVVEGHVDVKMVEDVARRYHVLG